MNENRIFIDTGAFIAKYIEKDQFYGLACKVWEKLENQKEKLVTSNFVLDETFTLLARQANYEFSVKVARIIYASDVIKIVRPSHETELNSLHLFDKYADQKVSFTDCVSFQLMKENRLKKVFSFDRHFQLAGFFSIC